MKNLKYDKYEIADYLKSPLFNNNTRNTLLAIRTRTVRGIRGDFGSLYPNKMCPLGCGDYDNLENILTCSVLKQYHKSTEMASTNCKYEDIFSKNISKQQKVTELYSQLLETRSRIMQSMPVANTGPVHGTPAVQRLPILS